MMIHDLFGKRCDKLIDWSYDCVDRIVLNGRYNFACSPGGFRTWWRDYFGDDSNLNDQTMRSIAYNTSRRIRKHCSIEKIPFIECVKGKRKDDIAASYVSEARRNGTTGLFLVLAGNAPAPVWKVQQTSEGKIINLAYKKPWPFVKHYNFHIMDKDWGHVIFKMCGYAPFGLQIIINGHNWVERQLLHQGLNPEMEDNCFVGVEEKSLHQCCRKLFGQQGAKALESVCEHWGYWCLSTFAMPDADRIRTRFIYHWSVYQLEVSRNYHFTTPAALDEVFQSIIDMTRSKLDIPRLKTIFGVRSRPRKRPNRAVSSDGRGRRDAITCSVNTPEYDLTVFKTRWANRTLKLYDKGQRTLRGECVIHNARALKTKRGLDNWPQVVKLMHESLIRFFDALDVLDVGLVDAGRLDQWKETEQVGKNRLAGIVIENVRMRALLNSLIELSVHNQKITRADLTAKTQVKMKKNGGYTARQASYDIRKLKANGLLKSQPFANKYSINLRKLRELVGVTTVYEKVFKKACAISANYEPTGKPAKLTLKECYSSLIECYANLFTTLKLRTQS